MAAEEFKHKAREAEAAYDKALEVFKADDAALGAIEAAASTAGVTP